MTSLVKSYLHNSVAKGIYNEILFKGSRYHYFLGKTIPWGTDEDDTPEEPIDSYSYEMETRSNIVTTKLINPTDVSFVAKRYDWIAGTIYDQYDNNYTVDNTAYSGAARLEDAKFYVVTDEFNVYKCISNNNNSPSTDKPTDLTSFGFFSTSDGYIWKFMYTIPAALRNRFLSAEHIPVTTALTSAYYDSGAIDSVIIENSGVGYTSASITVTGNGFLRDNPYVITSISVLSPGDGYSVAPAITISAPTVISGDEVQATATANLTSSHVSSITLTEAGYGYSDNVSATIAPPFTGRAWMANTEYADGEYIFVGNVYYLVTGDGFSGSTAPSHLTGTVANGDLSLSYAGRRATISINKQKTNAILTPILSGGEIIGVTVVDGGIGYTTANITVSGNGTGAQLLPYLEVGNVDTKQADVELQSVNGTIDRIDISFGGNGYIDSPVVTITGDGSGATAIATAQSGVLKSITITNNGQNYTYANVSVSSGSGAVVNVVISPQGGHGKDAVNELFCDTLSFYTNISTEKQQGFTVNNDYRQTGIIKNIKRYDDGQKFRSQIGAGCFYIECNLNQSKFPDDTLIKQNNGLYNFVVVATMPGKILLQGLTNELPEVGSIFSNQAGDTFVISRVVNPTIDKYSGDLLFIDNRQSFQTTLEQSVSFRTILIF